MSLLSRRLATLTLGVLSVIAVVSIPSFATQVVRHDSRVTISEKAPAFHGRVKSDAHPCEQQRKVKLFRAKRHAPDKFLGRDHTNNHGRWQVDVNPLKSGAYYAKVARRSEGTAGTIHVCKRDSSRIVPVD
jgi:hypothetical protein